MLKRAIGLPKNRSFFLFGPRQTGKSTLLKATFPKQTVLYYDLLKTDEYRRLATRPHIFREEIMARNQNQTHVIIDEIQRIPDLLNEIHFILENTNPPYFCMSGSSARKLKRSQANLLGGRAWTYNLYPLTHRECGSLFSLEKAMRIGTLPSIYLESNEADAHKTLKAYTDTYLKEEIDAEAITRNIGGFLRFLTLAASENGNIINYSNIARETGISYKTVKEHFQILQDTLVGFLLMPYSRSIRKKLVKHPKFYFFDTGVTRTLSGKLAVPLAPGTSEYGKIFEHFLVTEIARLIDYSQKDYTLSFYRTEAGAEVDLIIETPEGQTHAIEIKASESPETTFVKGLKSFHDICPQARLYCLCLSPRPRISNDIKILPWQDIFDHIGI